MPYTDASTNTATEALGTEPQKITGGTADNHEPRQRIDSLSAHNQPIPPSPSFVNENYEIRKRIASVGTGAACRPSFIKGQEKVRFMAWYRC